MPLSKFQIWLLAARPKTLPAGIAPVLIGTALAKATGGMHLLSALAALFGAIMIQVGTNFANDYFDFVKGADSSERIGPTRVTQAGLVTPVQIKRAIVISFSFAFFAGIYLVFRGGWPIVIVGLSSILFGILYTGGPWPLGYNGLGELFVLIFFGPVAVGGTYFVQTGVITMPVIIAGFGPGFLSVAILCVNNLRDINSDRVAGKRTLAVRFGDKFARAEYIVSVAIAIMIPLLLVSEYSLNEHLLVTLVAIVPLVAAVKIVFSGAESSRLNSVLAATGRSLLLYAILFSLGLLW